MAICSGELSDLKEFEEWLESFRPDIAFKYKYWHLPYRLAFYKEFVKERDTVLSRAESSGSESVLR